MARLMKISDAPERLSFAIEQSSADRMSKLEQIQGHLVDSYGVEVTEGVTYWTPAIADRTASTLAPRSVPSVAALL
jgi:hypothetical protein